ncbi:Na/Pi symporter [Alkalibacillus haloalkaliphilus]|uniref:Na/Pi symporter n=1 Tax=Alkalibacillus haloalkaliphilus TaxID=94136 RepID=UPI002935369B|nr:Na/Pi symporter [Alkalibacillus haloalkaliphilus]MDV2581031.1 Na/Pi symporter [Alkalibacillus haloalkaliphilus]
MYSLTLLIFVFIAIFIFGIVLMRIGFQTLTYTHLKQFTPKLSPLNGLIAGLLITALLQSSSASIALLITFMASMRRSLKFAICYLIGANIGTTFTVQLFVWNNLDLMWFCLIVGVLLILIPLQHYLWFSAGVISFGLGIIFTALYGLENLASVIPTQHIEQLIGVEQQSTFHLMLLGFMLTTVIQSSTTVTGILMSFSTDGLIPLSHIYYLLLGINIGTCITILIVSISQPFYAKITAYAHIWINVLGAIIALPAIFRDPLIQLTTWLTSNPEQQIVFISILYNVVTGVIFLLLLSPFCRFITFIHKDKSDLRT